MTRPKRFPNLERIASRAFAYQFAVALALLGLLIWSGEALSGVFGVLLTVGFAFSIGFVSLPVVLAWDESIVDASWAKLYGRDLDRLLVWPLLAIVPFLLLNWVFVLDEWSFAVESAETAVAYVGLGGLAATVALLVAAALVFVLMELAVFVFTLLVMALPALGVSWARALLEGEKPFWTRRRKAVAITAVLVLAAPTVAGAVGGLIGDDGGQASAASAGEDHPTFGDFRDKMTVGEYERAADSYGCDDEPFAAQGYQFPEYPVSETVNQSSAVEIAPYYWNTSDRDGRVDGWYHIRLTNTSTVVATDANVVNADAYGSENYYGNGHATGATGKVDFKGAPVVYAYFDVVDEDGQLQRHTVTLCPPADAG